MEISPLLHVDTNALSDAERAALVERLCASLAHALADRLMVIAGRVDVLASNGSGTDAKHNLEEIRAQMRQITELLDRARRFGEHLRPPLAATDIGQAVAFALEEIEPLARARQIEIAADPVSARVARLPSGVLVVVMRSLLAFAVARCGAGTCVRLGVELAVVDRGPSSVECIVLGVQLPAGTSLPRGTRALVDPWLSEPEGDAKARLLLALAVGTVRDQGGWARIDVESESPTLTLHWPAEPARQAADLPDERGARGSDAWDAPTH